MDDGERSDGCDDTDSKPPARLQPESAPPSTAAATAAPISLNEPTQTKRKRAVYPRVRVQHKRGSKPARLKPDELHVDWGTIADSSSSHWGREPLDRYISVPEMDSLVGWATHCTSSSSRGPPPGERRTTTKTTTATTAESINRGQHQYNPLLGLATSNTPLRPSILKHLIQDPATSIVKAMDEWKDALAVEMGLDTSATSASSSSRHRRGLLWECMDHSAAVALGTISEEMLTAALLPLARRHVQRCRHLQDTVDQEDTSADDAAVSVAALTDDSAPATAPSSVNTPTLKRRELNHLVHEEWTLPPEEAILRLLQGSSSISDIIISNTVDPSFATNNNSTLHDASQAHAFVNGAGRRDDQELVLRRFVQMATPLATMLPPTRSSVSGAVGTSVLNQPSVGEREQQALAAWYCRHSQSVKR